MGSIQSLAQSIAKAGGLESTNAASFEGLKLSSDGALIVEAQIFGGEMVFFAMHHVFVVLKLSNKTNSSSSYVLLERTNTGIVCQYGMTQEQAVQLRAYGSTSPRSAWVPSWKAPPGAGVEAQGLYDFITADKTRYHTTANNCRKFALVVCYFCGEDAYQALSNLLPDAQYACLQFIWRRGLAVPLARLADLSAVPSGAFHFLRLHMRDPLAGAVADPLPTLPIRAASGSRPSTTASTKL
jgi:hypothetical protein